MDYKVEGVTVSYAGEDVSEKLSPRQKLLHDILYERKEQEYLQQDAKKAEKNGYLFRALSPIRQNLLEWIEFPEGADILELGGGTGILTEMLCRRCARVTSVVTNVGDAYINAVRNRGKSHLRILVPRGDVTLDGIGSKAYDAVILVGAEHKLFEALFGSGAAADAAGEFSKLLALANTRLKEGGRLILAVNNRLGLQYWAGKTDACSPGIGDCLMGAASCREYCFSRNRLSAILRENGFSRAAYYYPIPDYLYADQIFSGDYLPGVGDIRPASSHYDSERYQFFDEKKVFDTLCEDRCFEMFANSFLILSEPDRKLQLTEEQ